MSDRNEHDKSLDADAAPVPGVDARQATLLARRRFAKAGAAAPVVLGSLLSKPVLASDKRIYHCTLSGKMSGNFSSHPDTIDCKTLGKSPGYWKTHTTWPTGTVAGTLPSGTCSFSGGTKGTAFNGFSAGGVTLGDAFRRKSVGSSTPVCTVYDRSEGSTYTGISATYNKATMLEILNTGGGLNETSLKALGRATVASLLNSIAFAPNYPLTPKQVIQMFNAVYTGGKYAVNATTLWDANEVKTHFESLYGNA